MTNTATGKENISLWKFRREITLGTLVQLFALLFILIAGWSNLQKELALIRHELNQLNNTHLQLRNHMEKLADKEQEHELRLRVLEKADVQG